MVESISFYGERVKNKDADDEEYRKRMRSLYVGQMPEMKAVTFNGKYEARSIMLSKRLRRVARELV